MGQFSWLDCVDNKPILDGVTKTSYVLVPQEFGGGHISERCYDGYGHFGGKDIYELVLDWNKKFIPQYMEIMRNGNWECEPSTKDFENLQNYYEGKPISCEDRWLGIVLSCYDEDNFRLKYPIKITYNPNVTYEECEPSEGDPNQGWGSAETADMVFIVTCKLPEGKSLDKSSVTKLIKSIFSGEVEGEPEMIINNGAEMSDWYGDNDYGDDDFEARVHATLLDEDNDEYIVDRLYSKFEAAGYIVDDVYWDFD